MAFGKKWYSAGLHFECYQCGKCCGGFPGYVWATEEELQGIADFLKMGIDQFKAEYTVKERRRISLRETPDYDCVFLKRDANGNGKCSIYSVRPQQCRTWPFWKSNTASPDNWNAQVDRCPGINKGKCYTVEEIDEVRDSSPC